MLDVLPDEDSQPSPVCKVVSPVHKIVGEIDIDVWILELLDSTLRPHVVQCGRNALDTLYTKRDGKYVLYRCRLGYIIIGLVGQHLRLSLLALWWLPE